MKIIGNREETSINALQLFEPDAGTVYTIEAVAHLAQVPRRLIVLYYKHGLVTPIMDPARGGWYFDGEAIRIVRHVEYLRGPCGVSLEGIKLILGLAREVERLRQEVRFLHRR